MCMASVTLITLIVWSWTCGAKMIQAFETFSEFYCTAHTHTQIMQSSLKTSRLLTKQPKDLFSIGTLEFQALVGHQSFGLLRTMHLHGVAMVRNGLEVVFCEFLETQIFHTPSTHGASCTETRLAAIHVCKFDLSFAPFGTRQTFQHRLFMFSCRFWSEIVRSCASMQHRTRNKAFEQPWRSAVSMPVAFKSFCHHLIRFPPFPFHFHSRKFRCCFSDRNLLP